MAISLLTAHIANNDHVCADLPIIFTLDSNDADIKKLSLDIDVGGATVQTVVKAPDLGTTDEFTFDLSNVVSDNLGFETLATTVTNDEATNTYKQVTYDGKELVQNTSTGLLEDGATSIPAGDIRTFYAHNAVLQHPSLQGATAEADLSNYMMDTSGQARKFLNNAPTDAKLNKRYLSIETDDEVFLQYIADFDSVTGMAINTLDSSGSVINLYSNSIAETGVKRYFSRCSYDYFGSLHAGFLTDFASNGAVAYRVWLLDALNNVYSEYFYFKVEAKCARKKIRFHWVNQFGAWDSWNFYGHPIVTDRAIGKMFSQRNDTPFSAVGNNEGGDTVLSKTATRKVTTVAKNLTSGERSFLSEMLTSPLVFVENGSNFDRVVLDTGSIDKENYQNNLHSVKVSYHYSNEVKGLRN